MARPPDRRPLGDWYRVRRANKKTVTVPNHIISAPQPGEREWTDTRPWHEVREHRTTEQMPKAFVDTYETPGTNRLHLNWPTSRTTPAQATGPARHDRHPAPCAARPAR